MKRIVPILSIGLALMVAGQSSTEAGPIAGSQALSGSVSPLPVDLLTATTITADLFTFSAQTGDYVGVPFLTNAGTSTIDTTNLTTFGFSSSAFGAFATTSAAELASPSGTRTFLFHGMFTPGTLFPGSLTSNTASLLVQLGQVAVGGAVSWSATLRSPDAYVPEPTSIALTGIGLSFVSLFRGLRKRMRK